MNKEMKRKIGAYRELHHTDQISTKIQIRSGDQQPQKEKNEQILPSSLDNTPISSHKDFINIFYTKYSDKTKVDLQNITEESQQEVVQTANTIRSIINRHTDITNLDKQDKHNDNIDILLEDITQNEIKSILKKKRNTTRGPDGIPYTVQH